MRFEPIELTEGEKEFVKLRRFSQEEIEAAFMDPGEEGYAELLDGAQRRCENMRAAHKMYDSFWQRVIVPMLRGWGGVWIA